MVHLPDNTRAQSRYDGRWCWMDERWARTTRVQRVSRSSWRCTIARVFAEHEHDRRREVHVWRVVRACCRCRAAAQAQCVDRLTDGGVLIASGRSVYRRCEREGQTSSAHKHALSARTCLATGHDASSRVQHITEMRAQAAPMRCNYEANAVLWPNRHSSEMLPGWCQVEMCQKTTDYLSEFIR